MKIFLILKCLIICLPLCSLAQYSTVSDIYNRNQEIIWEWELKEERLFASVGVICDSFECSAVSEINVETGDTLWSRMMPWMDASGNGIASKGDTIFLGGYNPPIRDRIYLHKSIGKDSISTNIYSFPDSLNNIAMTGLFQYRDKTIYHGRINKQNGTVDPAFICSINNSGELDTIIQIASGNNSNIIFRVQEDKEGYLTVLNESFENTPEPNSFFARRKHFLKFDENLKLVWEWRASIDQRYQGQVPSRFLVMSNGKIVFPSDDNSSFRREIWALEDQEIVWKYNFPWDVNSARYQVNHMIEAANGDIVGCGTINGPPLPDAGIYGYFFRMSPNGIMLWERVVAENRNNEFIGMNNYLGYNSGGFSELVELDDGSFIFGGNQEIWYYDENNDAKSNDDIWIVRTDAEGCLLDECGYLQDLTSRLYQPMAYDISLCPNPTSDYFVINYSKDISLMEVFIYNLSGHLVFYLDGPVSGEEIFVNQLLTGMYIIKGTTKEGGVWTDKIFVN